MQECNRNRNRNRKGAKLSARESINYALNSVRILINRIKDKIAFRISKKIKKTL